jgi:hypothetical protein
MLDFLMKYAFIIGALTGSVAAYLLGLFVNYVRREKRMLGFSVRSRKIVELGHKDLTIFYKGQPIERLYSHEVTIKNIGNRALKDLPVKIKFEKEFLDPELNQPEGAQFKMTIENNNEIVVNCDLLERNESLYIGFTSIDLVENDKELDIRDKWRSLVIDRPPKVSVIARVENLQCKDLDTMTYPTLVELFSIVFSDALRSIVR